MTTDTTLLRAASEAIAVTVEDGGGTFERGTLLHFRPTSGFAVGLGGAILPADQFTAEALARLSTIIPGEYEASYLGTWLHEDKVHVDAVAYFGRTRRAQAIAAGLTAGQLAIYDFSTKESIDL